MNRWILGSGTIVTSAVALYSWHPSFMQTGDLIEGKPSSDLNPSEFSESSHAKDKQGIHRRMIPMISHTLERLSFNHQWSHHTTDRLPRSMEKMYHDLLQQAQVDVEAGNIAAAVTQIAGIPKNSQHYEMAQQLQNDWSQELLQQATKLYQQADLVGALSILKTIPPTCEQSDRITSLREQWSQEAVWLERAITAHREGRWEQAIESVRTLDGRPIYHSVLVQDILQDSISNRLRPDEHLMQIASANLPTASTIPIRMPDPDPLPSPSTLIPMEPLPPPTLPVDVNRALEWSQLSTIPALGEIAIADRPELNPASLTDKPTSQPELAFDSKPLSRQAIAP